MRRFAMAALTGTITFLVACGPGAEPAPAPVPAFPCDADNGGIKLPQGFCATVFADELGTARHVTVGPQGNVYVQREPVRRRDEAGQIVVDSPGGVVALRDSDADGKADVSETLNEISGTGIEVRDGWLYYSSDTEVHRVRLEPGQLAPTAPPEVLVSGFPSQSQHESKPFTFDDAGNIYVTIGGPSNACQEQMRTPGSPGIDPCPQLVGHGGIWRFAADRAGQMVSDGTRYATGIRNAVALDWNHQVGALYAVQHGRDSLSQLFPEHFNDEQSAELPAEEMFRIAEGDDFGWPYCYYDHLRGAKVLAPEYGGDGEAVGRCAEVAPTLLAFPGHWAPNDLLFYDDGSFPERYRGGAFIAFHGSWNRMPLPQQGYKVVFVPLRDGAPAGDWEVFADGFAQVESIRSPGDARHRPMGLAQGPDGSLYITDSRQGRIWRVRPEAAP